MAVENPKMVINAFTDAQIRTWDPVFKAASLEKAKLEMPKTYQELEILMRVLDSVSNHMSVGHNSKEKLEIMRTALKVQFNNYEISWESSWGDVSDEALFGEFQELYSIADEAVDTANKALFESIKFLRENSIQNRDRKNGIDRNNGQDCNGYPIGDAKMSKIVQEEKECPGASNSVQESPRTSFKGQDSGN